MPDEFGLFAAMKRAANVKLAQNLSSTFDAIAKGALRASAEFADLENDDGSIAEDSKGTLCCRLAD
jgi:hypothetical protein